MIEKEFSSHDVEDLDEHSAGNSIFLAAAFFTFSADLNSPFKAQQKNF